ncbi:uroporphyrinogen-III synthase [Edaphobacter sp. 12200R-103]|uniref:uroporphyrinogen-III synthase n=1 Tax=Edaphobacter sp. 12200R-103 TaxID=2703788 RepID=UPI00138CDA3B|nr:uroporphyrinogen-III synthase [Edaphobacter sp. 12200R-103]QHS51013.1 uroporphyrinogen-III synthase [Edaphobacter sp. 12200R-103]
MPCESLSLANRRVMVTRTKAGSSELSEHLRSAGASVEIVPTIEIIPPVSYGPLDDALAKLDTFDWLVFTSANAVDVFAARRPAAISPGNVAVIGPSTGRAIERLGISVTLQPARYVAEDLAESLAPLVSGRQVLLIRAAVARDVLPQALEDAGAILTVVEAYRNRVPTSSVSLIRKMFASAGQAPDVITFTSASTARNLMDLLDRAGVQLPSGILLASIGPITSRVMVELGLKPDIEAGEATLSALAEAICHYFRTAV